MRTPFLMMLLLAACTLMNLNYANAQTGTQTPNGDPWCTFDENVILAVADPSLGETLRHTDEIAYLWIKQGKAAAVNVGPSGGCWVKPHVQKFVADKNDVPVRMAHCNNDIVDHKWYRVPAGGVLASQPNVQSNSQVVNNNFPTVPANTSSYNEEHIYVHRDGAAKYFDIATGTGNLLNGGGNFLWGVSEIIEANNNCFGCGTTPPVCNTGGGGGGGNITINNNNTNTNTNNGGTYVNPNNPNPTPDPTPDGWTDHGNGNGDHPNGGTGNGTPPGTGNSGEDWGSGKTGNNYVSGNTQNRGGSNTYTRNGSTTTASNVKYNKTNTPSSYSRNNGTTYQKKSTTPASNIGNRSKYSTGAGKTYSGSTGGSSGNTGVSRNYSGGSTTGKTFTGNTGSYSRGGGSNSGKTGGSSYSGGSNRGNSYSRGR